MPRRRTPKKYRYKYKNKRKSQNRFQKWIARIIKKHKPVVYSALAVLLILVFTIIFISSSHKKSEQELIKEASDDVIIEIPNYTTDLRIAISESDNDIYFNTVSIYSEDSINVKASKSEVTYEPMMAYERSSDSMNVGETVTISTAGAGRLFIKGKDIPYRGSLEMIRTESGICVVNNIDIEEYLYGVVGSEMPPAYPKEALKAQAVCARTYAYKHTAKFAYEDISAHMDDTISYQVYNKSSSVEDPAVINAVDATRGTVIYDNTIGDVVDSYFYSTSSGFMQPGTILHNDAKVYGSKFVGESQKDYPEDFDSYIRNPDADAYESEERLFRWSSSLYTDNIKQIRILKREKSGVVTEIQLDFNNGHKKKVSDQLEIRQYLGNICGPFITADGEQVDYAMLPSAVISIEKKSDTEFVIYGAGFGHGVGMSQNGAKAMASNGKSYTEIIEFFYKDIVIANIKSD